MESPTDKFNKKWYIFKLDKRIIYNLKNNKSKSQKTKKMKKLKNRLNYYISPLITRSLKKSK